MAVAFNAASPFSGATPLGMSSLAASLLGASFIGASSRVSPVKVWSDR